MRPLVAEGVPDMMALDSQGRVDRHGLTMAAMAALALTTSSFSVSVSTEAQQPTVALLRVLLCHAVLPWKVLLKVTARRL